MNKHVIPLLKQKLEVITAVLADRNWGRHRDEGCIKSYREVALEEKREYKKAIKFLNEGIEK